MSSTWRGSILCPAGGRLPGAGGWGWYVMVAGDPSATGDDHDDSRSPPGPPAGPAASRAGQRPAPARRLAPAPFAAQLAGAAVPAADLRAVDRAGRLGPEPERQHVRSRGLDLRRVLRRGLA